MDPETFYETFDEYQTFLSGMIEAAEDTYNTSLREAELENIDDDSMLLVTDEFDFEPEDENL